MLLSFGKRVKSLSSFIVIATILTACARPPSTTVGEGADPFQLDKDVVFRTTYYFRTFDYCVARELKNGQFKNVVVPLTDSLYRFRMTGKSNSLPSDVKFESGTLRAWEIDPFGAKVEYDPELRRHRVISPREADADARRAAIKRDLNEMLTMYDRIAERNADPSDQSALAQANRTKRQENDSAVLGKLSTALQGKIDELASVASGPDEADFTTGPANTPLTTAQRADILKTEVAQVITAMLPKASSADVATIMANYGDAEAMLVAADPARPGYVERVVREIFDKAYKTPATKTAIQTTMGSAKENTAQAAVTTLAKQKSTLLDLVEKNVSALWTAGGLAPSIQCPTDAPVRRSFQVLGPEGWRTFNQDERLLIAMSSSAAPIVSTLKDLSGRVLNARDNPEAELLPIAIEQKRLSEAGRVLDREKRDDGTTPRKIAKAICDKLVGKAETLAATNAKRNEVCGDEKK